jgi:hypothetical protein
LQIAQKRSRKSPFSIPDLLQKPFHLPACLQAEVAFEGRAQACFGLFAQLFEHRNRHRGGPVRKKTPLAA